MMREGYRGYVFARPFLGERVPQHVQNLVIRDYAARNGLTYKLSATEYAMDGCHMMLEQVVDELPALKGLICYSLFQLPVDTSARARIYARMLESGAELHAALEDLAVHTAADVGRMEDIWRVRLALAACPSTSDVQKAQSAGDAQP
jgi:sporadic carbohydrate cluster protein (TIGR04323 family)